MDLLKAIFPADLINELEKYCYEIRYPKIYVVMLEDFNHGYVSYNISSIFNNFEKALLHALEIYPGYRGSMYINNFINKYKSEKWQYNIRGKNCTYVNVNNIISIEERRMNLSDENDYNTYECIYGFSKGKMIKRRFRGRSDMQVEMDLDCFRFFKTFDFSQFD